MKNKDIKIALLVNSVRNYQVADALGITEFTFSRWLRRELTAEKKKIVLACIKKLSMGDIKNE